jgi:hypothetical protein
MDAGVRRAAPSSFTQFLLLEKVGLPFGKLGQQGSATPETAREALEGLVREGGRNVAQYQMTRGHLIRRIAAS